MSGVEGALTEYTVSCSGRVRGHLGRLAQTCRGRGDGYEFLAALREFERRLRVYPQFGDPLTDLGEVEGVIWVGIIRPLSMRYAVVESRRLVLLAALPVLMPMKSA